jgi:hypothetical protein
VKALGFAVKLDTNGSRRSLLWALLGQLVTPVILFHVLVDEEGRLPGLPATSACSNVLRQQDSPRAEHEGAVILATV